MIRKEDYPSNWPEISRNVRDEAGQMCEWCGAPNGAVVRRGVGAEWTELDHVENQTDGEIEFTDGMKWPRLKYHGLTRIVLTVAHLDRNSHNNDRQNLAALCQRCHLSHDILQHVANRKYGRLHAKDHQLKLILPSNEEETRTKARKAKT